MNYPIPEKIIEFNELILSVIKVKKADSPKLLSYNKLLEIIDECVENKGDVYDKAVILMKGIIKKHAFASGNRRTAFITTKHFVINNNGKFNIEDNPSNANAMQGIREDYYSHDELKEWIKNGKIREFK
jgi:prophage maintenance system killer protein